jgi:hypothetical protein
MASASPTSTAAFSDEAWIAQRLAQIKAARHFVHPASLDPNYVPSNRGYLIIIVTVVSLGLALLTVFLRLWVRLTRHIKKLRWDDWIIIPSTVSKHILLSMG